MITLDLPTILFSYLLTIMVSTAVMFLLWLQNRKRFEGVTYWLTNFVLQTTALILIILRRHIPDWISIDLSNIILIAGCLLGLLGLEMFTGKKNRNIHNFILLAIFSLVHIWFTFVKPDLAIRNLNLSVAMLIIFSQCVWLLLHRVSKDIRRIGFVTGIVFIGFILVSIARIVNIFIEKPVETDYFNSGKFETAILLSYQILFILLTYSLTLMYNGRLIYDIVSQEKKYSKTFQLSPYSILLTRLSDGKIIEVNDKFLNISGYKLEEVRNSSTLELNFWDREEDRLAIVEELSQNGKVDEIELQFRKKSGEKFTGIVSCETLTLKNESCILTSISDISIRKKAEEVIRRNEENLRAVLDATPFPVAIVDLQDDVIDFWSRSAADLFGHIAPTTAEWYKIAYPDATYRQEVINRWKPLLEIARETKKSVNTGEYRVTCKDDSIRICELYATFLQDHLIVTFDDITERKHAEEALKESEKTHRLLIQNLQSGLVVHAPDSQIVLANEQASRLLGLTIDQMMDKTAVDPAWCFVFEDGTIMPVEEYPVTKVIASLEPIRDMLLGINRPVTNDRVWVLVNAFPEFDNAGKLLQVVVTFNDISKLKQAEEKIVKAEKYYRSLIEKAPDGVVLIGIDGKMSYASPTARRIFGYEQDEILPNPAESTHPEDLPAVLRTLENITLNPSLVLTLEYRFKRKDGSWNWVESTFSNQFSEEGISAIVVNFRDITARKKAEEELRLKDIVFDGSIAANSISDVNWIIRQANAAFISAWGYSSKEEVIGRHMSDFVEHESEISVIFKSLNDFGKWSGEYIARRKDGSTFIAYSLATRILNSSGEVIGYQSSVQDITERKKAEETLIESEKKFRNLFENSPLGKSMTGLDGSIHVNKSFYEMLGYSEEELRGKNWRDITHPDDIEISESYLQILLDGKSDNTRFEKRFIHKNGNIVFTDLSTYLQRDNQGVAVYYISTVSDITERKLIEDKIHKLNEDLESRVAMRTVQLVAANKELEAFSYSVSHDLRAPLRAIHSFANILAEDYRENLDTEGRRITDIIKSSSVHLGRLIDDLLEFSRTGRSGLNYSRINMTQLVRSVYQELTQEKEKGRVIFLVHKLQPVSGDIILLKQVVRNLLSNALKYTSKKEIAEIEIGSETNNNEIIYWIRDNGVGFDMHYMNKLFGVFQRLHSTREFEGNGVGLAIVKRIILRHEGRVWAEGEVNNGAKFYFALPEKN